MEPRTLRVRWSPPPPRAPKIDFRCRILIQIREGGPKDTKSAPRAPQEPPRAPQEPPRAPQERPKSTPRAPQEPPRAPRRAKIAPKLLLGAFRFGLAPSCAGKRSCVCMRLEVLWQLCRKALMRTLQSYSNCTVVSAQGVVQDGAKSAPHCARVAPRPARVPFFGGT